MLPTHPNERPAGRVARQLCHVLVICTALSIFGSSPAWVQDAAAQSADRPGPRRLSAVVADLPAGTEVRVLLPSSTELIGRLVTSEPDRLVLDLAADIRPVDLNEVSSLWVRGNAGRKGALIGGAATGLAFAIYGGLATDGLCSALSGGGCDAGVTTGGAALGAALGFATGGLVGWLVGSAIPSWHLRYP